jgi:hypothetical protein
MKNLIFGKIDQVLGEAKKDSWNERPNEINASFCNDIGCWFPSPTVRDTCSIMHGYVVPSEVTF